MVDLNTRLFGREAESGTLTYALRRDGWRHPSSGNGDILPALQQDCDPLEQTLHRLSRWAGPTALFMTLAAILWMLAG